MGRSSATHSVQRAAVELRSNSRTQERSGGKRCHSKLCIRAEVKGGAEGGVQKRGVTAASAYFFPRDFVEAPPEKLPEGRHYREFFHEGAQEFSIDFPPIWVTFSSPGLLLATLEASLGPGLQFLMNFKTVLGSPGLPRGTLGSPCGPHGASWCRPGFHF